MKKTTLITLVAAWIIFNLTSLTGCKKTEIGTPGENEVFLLYKTFTPTQLTIKKGTTVTFTNKDNANHSVTANNHLFDSGKITSGTSYTYTFNDVGSYFYSCNYHSSIQQEQGVITVQ